MARNWRVGSYVGSYAILINSTFAQWNAQIKEMSVYGQFNTNHFQSFLFGQQNIIDQRNIHQIYCHIFDKTLI